MKNNHVSNTEQPIKEKKREYCVLVLSILLLYLFHGCKHGFHMASQNIEKVERTRMTTHRPNFEVSVV